MSDRNGSGKFVTVGIAFLSIVVNVWQFTQTQALEQRKLALETQKAALVTQHEELKGEKALLEQAKSDLVKKQGELEERLRTSMASAGMYGDPSDAGLMASLAGYLGQSVDGAAQTAFVVSDIACFGAFSHHARFQQYKDTLIRLAQRSVTGPRQVKAVFLSRRAAGVLLEKQFRNWDGLISTGGFREKLGMWFRHPEVRAVLEASGVPRAELDALDKPAGVTGLTPAKLVEDILIYNESVIQDFRNAGVQVRRHDSMLPLHLWLLSPSHGIACVPDVEGVWDEPGFFVRNEFFQNLLLIADRLFDNSPA